jgi:hypothetical protein
MAPRNRARSFGGGGGGGFDLGALLLMGAGMPKENEMFGQDEESWRAATGDYKSKFDGDSPYKKTNAIQRYAGNDADIRNAEYKLGQKQMQQQFELQKDMEKVKLANELAAAGFQRESAMLLESTSAANRAKLQEASDRAAAERIGLSGKEDRATLEKRSELTRGDVTHQGEVTKGVTAADLLGRFNTEKLGVYPSTKEMPVLSEKLQNNAMYNADQASKFTDADLLLKQNTAKKAGYLDIGSSGTMDISSPDKRVTMFDKGAEAGLNSPARKPSVFTQPTRFNLENETVGVGVQQRQATPRTMPATSNLIMRDVGTRDTGEMVNENGKKMVTKQGELIGLPATQEQLLAERLKKKRSLLEMQDLLMTPQTGQWPPR